MINLNVNGLVCYLTEVGGDEDDIIFVLETETGEVIQDNDVYEYVYENYPEVLYQEWFETQLTKADHLMDSIKDNEEGL